MSDIQKYTPEVKQATAQIVQQLPPEINSLALQAKIAEAIVARSEARILNAINEALAYRPSTQPAQQNPVNYSINVGDINLNVDNSQNINYWVDASQHHTDNSRNYWADNRRYEDNSSHSSLEVFGFDLSVVGLIGLILMVFALAFSQPCGQEIQRQQQQLQQQEGVL